MIFFVGVLKFSFVGYKFEIEDGASPVLRGVRASPWGGEFTVRLLKPDVLEAFEHPLKIMLMLLGIVVENSKQYGSKWHKLFFQIV